MISWIARNGTRKACGRTLATISLLPAALAAMGCSQGAMLVQESSHGGIVTYLYRDDRGGPMFSRHRAEALEIIARKCRAGYTIVQEAEARGRQTVQGIVEGTEDDPPSRRWGMKFRCAPARR